MRQLTALFTLLVCLASPALASDLLIEAVMAVDQNTRPADSFSPSTPRLYAFFRSQGTVKGDRLRAVWIAEDVGRAAPANFRIDESAITADSNNFFGAFSLSKPDQGWPLGRYRVEIHANDGEPAVTVRFSIR